MEGSFSDKNHLAMLAIPIILSMLLGFSADPITDIAASEGGRTESSTYRSDESESREELSQSKKNNQTEKRIAVSNVGDDIVRRQKIESALEAADYEKFLSHTQGTPFSEIMTKEGFDMLVHEYNMRKDGYRPSVFSDMV